jgi:2-methylcitrate dehydratase PrpD
MQQASSSVATATLAFCSTVAGQVSPARRFAGAATIDAIDAHDGHVLTKGHAGVAILPTLLAMIDGRIPVSRPRPSTAANSSPVWCWATKSRPVRGLALHTSVADYHCSGAWNALGCAGVAARLLVFDAPRIRQALGVAEYFGPRGQICVPASPRRW